MGLVRIRDRLIRDDPPPVDWADGPEALARRSWPDWHEHKIECDASCFMAARVGAVAAVADGFELLVCELVDTGLSDRAEWIAVELAMAAARERGWPHVLFKTDSTAVAHRWRMLSVPEPRWRLQRVDRGQVRQAHVAARRRLRAWEGDRLRRRGSLGRMAIAVGPSAVVKLVNNVLSEREVTVKNDGPDSVSLSKDPVVAAAGADAFVLAANTEQDVTLAEGEALYAITAAAKSASVEVI